MDAVIYQIYPRSFCDTSGNGIGDLDGVRRHLDHLTWLGVDGLWLSPIFPSPMADLGYDVADYCDVDPLFGDLDQLDRLVADAHERGLRVLLDWVPNHSSDAHPWFVASRSSRDDPKRDWYVWVDGTPDRPPTPWEAAFPPGPAWTWDEPTQAWYYHRFTPHQPDLNWTNPEVERAMHQTLQFWLDRGIDGFRMDVIHRIGKDLRGITTGAEIPVDRWSASRRPAPARTHELLRRIRKVIDAYDGDRVAIGEVPIFDLHEVATYVGAGAGELHLALNHMPLFMPWTAAAWHSHLEEATRAFVPRQAWPAWVLSNHDISRVRTRLGSEAAARSAAMLLLGLRGTPFLYAGEELGLEDAVVPAERAVDPAGVRDGCRAPIPWDGSPTHGWGGADLSAAEPWLPWPPEAGDRNVEDLRRQQGSILHLHRRLLAARRASPALRAGDQRLLPLAASGDVLAWERYDGDDRRIVGINFAGEARRLDPGPGDWCVDLSSTDLEESRSFDGELAPFEAVWLRPADQSRPA
jgi:alpha-glucosidase